MSDSWENTLREQMSKLELIASWASMTNLGSVRDYCRKAKYEIQRELEHYLDLCESH